MEKYIFLIVISVLVLIIVILFLLYYRQENRLRSIERNNQSFDLTNVVSEIKNEMLKFQHEVTLTLKDDLNNLNKNTSDSLLSVTKNVSEGLNMGFEKTNFSFNEVSKQLVSINETQKGLNSLSDDILKLQNVLVDKKSRGTYGEIELYSILKSAYGINDEAYAKQYRLSNNTIADAVIFNASPLNKVVIDSKFPMENYIRMNDETLMKSEQTSARNQFSRDVKKHIDDINKKYIIKGETAEMAYLFIPAEAIFSEIYGKFSDIVQYSYEAKVYLVSPTTLMAYITALKAIYLNIEQNDKVDQIQSEFIKLAVEFERFEKRYQSVSKDFTNAYRDMQSLDITVDKIIKRFNEIEKVQLDGVENE